MCKVEQLDELEEFLDEEFFEMEIDDKVKYLKLHPNKKVSLDDVETEYFNYLSQDILKKGETELYYDILEKYFNASVELQYEMYYRRVRPSFEAIYNYGMHVLNNKLTSFDDMEIEIKKIFINFCILNCYFDHLEYDNILDQFPQLLTFYENLDEFAYADDEAMYPMILRSVGQAYQKGTKHFKKDLEKAFRFFELGSSLDYSGRQSEFPFQQVANCLFEVAICYMKGLGVEKDLDKALESFTNAARDYGLNYIPAMAEIYFDEDFEWKNYFDDKTELIIAAFEAYENSDDSLYYLSLDWNSLSDDYDKDRTNNVGKKIIDELKKLADNGDIDAKYRLATAYEKGIIVEKNLELALKYHSEIANEGDYSHSTIFCFEHYTPSERESYLIPTEVKVGDEFYFGKLLDEPLKWKVVEIHEDGPIVISEKVIAYLPYSDYSADYENSYVRRWLNNQFFNKIFTDYEKQHILYEKYYAMSFKRINYGDKILLQDHLFLPYSVNIKNWFGEGKEEWKVIPTEFAKNTGDSENCWLLDAYDERCPRYVNKNNTKTRIRYSASSKFGVRPIMLIKL